MSLWCRKHGRSFRCCDHVCYFSLYFATFGLRVKIFTECSDEMMYFNFIYSKYPIPPHPSGMPRLYDTYYAIVKLVGLSTPPHHHPPTHLLKNLSHVMQVTNIHLKTILQTSALPYGRSEVWARGGGVLS